MCAAKYLQVPASSCFTMTINLLAGIWFLCQITIAVVILMQKNGGDDGTPISRGWQVLFAWVFQILTSFSFIVVFWMGRILVRLAQRPLLSRWGIKVKAVVERWRHQKSRHGELNFIKVSYSVPLSTTSTKQHSSLKYFDDSGAALISDKDVSFTGVSSADNETEAAEKTVFDVRDVTLYKHWFAVTSDLYSSSRNGRNIALIVLPNYPRVVMTEQEAGGAGGCVDFCQMLLLGHISAVFGICGIFLPVSGILGTSSSSLWFLVPYFCGSLCAATAAVLIYYRYSEWEDFCKDDTIPL